MELKNGNIELLGTIFGKETTTKDALKNTALEASVDKDPSSDPIIDIFYAENAIVDGVKFYAEIHFVSRKIDYIHLVPIDLEMANPGYPDSEYQELKKKTCDAFLLKALGEPTQKNEAVTYYKFDWGGIASVALYGGRNENAGGFIDIEYNRKD